MGERGKRSEEGVSGVFCGGNGDKVGIIFFVEMRCVFVFRVHRKRTKSLSQKLCAFVRIRKAKWGFHSLHRFGTVAVFGMGIEFELGVSKC